MSAQNIVEKEVRLDTKTVDAVKLESAIEALKFKLTQPQFNVLQVGVSDVKLPPSITFFDSKHTRLVVDFGFRSEAVRLDDNTLRKKGKTYEYHLDILLNGYLDTFIPLTTDGMVNYLNSAFLEATNYGNLTVIDRITEIAADGTITVEHFAAVPQVHNNNGFLSIWIAQIPTEVSNGVYVSKAKNMNQALDYLEFRSDQDPLFPNFLRHNEIGKAEESRVVNYITRLSVATIDSLNRSLGFADNKSVKSGYVKDVVSDYVVTYGDINEDLTIGRIDNPMIVCNAAGNDCVSHYRPGSEWWEYKNIWFDTGEPINRPAGAASVNPEVKISVYKGDAAGTTEAQLKEYLLADGKVRETEGAIYGFISLGSYGAIEYLGTLVNLKEDYNSIYEKSFTSIRGTELVRINHGIDTLYVVCKDLPVLANTVAATNNYMLNNYNVLTTLEVDRQEAGGQSFRIDTRFSFTYLPLSIPTYVLEDITIGFVAYLGKKEKYHFVAIENVEELEIVLRVYKEHKP